MLSHWCFIFKYITLMYWQWYLISIWMVLIYLLSDSLCTNSSRRLMQNVLIVNMQVSLINVDVLNRFQFNNSFPYDFIIILWLALRKIVYALILRESLS